MPLCAASVTCFNRPSVWLSELAHCDALKEHLHAREVRHIHSHFITWHPSTTCIWFFFYLFGGFSLFPLLMAVFSLSSSSSWRVTHTILRITFLCFINQLYSTSLDPFSRIFPVLYILPLYLYLYPCSHHAILIDLAIHAFEKSPPTPS